MKLELEKTALLLIDLQNGFYHPESEMGKNVGVENRQHTIPVVAKLVDYARQKNVPIFWSKQIHFPDDVTRKTRILRSHAEKQKFLPCLKGSFETELYDPFLKLHKEEDHIIEKHRATLFYDTNLPTKLRMLGIKNLIIAGCNTEFCIAHTIRDAYARDYELIIIEDATAGIDPKLHQYCLEVFHAYFAEVIKFEKIKEYFNE
jgi:ureidoacrylate peracid hydrolase